jgi:hypothetical protein
MDPQLFISMESLARGCFPAVGIFLVDILRDIFDFRASFL